MREIAKEELRKQKQEFCPVCQAQMENQTIAVLLLAINKRYGWKEKGLRQVLECAKALGLYIHNTGDWYPSLSEFSTVYCDPHSQRLWHSQ